MALVRTGTKHIKEIRDLIIELKEMSFNRWKPYDPTWLIAACEYRFEEYPWLKEALLNCNKAKVRSRFYTYFEKSSRPNKRGSNWHIQDTILIEGTIEGDLLMDIIECNRVGGIEFYERLLE